MLTRLLSLLSLGLVALLVGCGSSAPGQEEVRSVVEERLAQAFPEPVLQLTSLRRFDFSSWQSLNLAALANLLGATEKGISGLKQGGNKQGDVLHVHGSVAFVDMAGGWQPQAAVRTAVAAPPPEDNTGGRPPDHRGHPGAVRRYRAGPGPAGHHHRGTGRGLRPHAAAA